jgi:predicted O-methyltransferase YrrM
MRDSKNFSPKLDYINSLFNDESQVSLKIQKELKKDKKWGINVSRYEAMVLQWLIRLNKTKSIVEVGTLYGYSTYYLAEACKEFNGHVYSIETNISHYEHAKNFLIDSENITLLHGDAKEVLEELSLKAPFDLVFIDANKSSYIEYLDWAESNVRKGGYIIGDNTFLFGHVYANPWQSSPSIKTINAMKEFNERLMDSKKYNSILLNTDEGMTIAQKK